MESVTFFTFFSFFFFNVFTEWVPLSVHFPAQKTWKSSLLLYHLQYVIVCYIGYSQSSFLHPTGSIYAPLNPSFSAPWSFFADFGSFPRNSTAAGGDNPGDQFRPLLCGHLINRQEDLNRISYMVRSKDEEHSTGTRSALLTKVAAAFNSSGSFSRVAVVLCCGGNEFFLPKGNRIERDLWKQCCS